MVQPMNSTSDKQLAAAHAKHETIKIPGVHHVSKLTGTL